MSDGIAPSIETYKKSARALKKAVALGDAQSVTRVAAHVAPDRTLKHADFLHVIAREAGHASWPALRFALETARLSRAERAERLKMALYHGQNWVIDKLLGDDPALKDDNLGLQIALYDLQSVQDVLESDPEAATRIIGVRSPILHLAFSREIHRSPAKSGDMLALAALLVAKGADIDDGYAAQAGENEKVSALYGALCHADNYELGRWLLEQGANPDDNESLYHSTELSGTRALQLMLKHGARPDGTNALPRALDFDSVEKVALLLEAGANPNLTMPDQPGGLPMNSVPSLHQAVRRGRSLEVVELLLKHGADPDAVWQGHSAYATALMYGNFPAARLLADRGYATPLSPNEKVFAACAEGAPAPGRLDAAALVGEDELLLTLLAFIPGKLDHMKALVAAGLDPDKADHFGLPPLHVAGWNGLAEETAYFLSLAPDLTRKNGYGGDALDTVVHGSEFAPGNAEADHIACARLLLEAGSVLHAGFISGSGNEDMVAFLEAWRDSHP